MAVWDGCTRQAPSMPPIELSSRPSARRATSLYYKHGTEERPMMESVITVPYKTATGIAEKKFTVYYTMHGPVVRKNGDKWVTFAMMNEPVSALTQSYTRTKAKNYPGVQGLGSSCTRIPRTTPSTPTPMATSRISMATTSLAASTSFGLDPPRGRQQPCHGLQGLTTRSTNRPSCSIPRAAGSEQQQLAMVGRGSRAARRRKTSPSTSTTAPNPRAAFTP